MATSHCRFAYSIFVRIDSLAFFHSRITILLALGALALGALVAAPSSNNSTTANSWAAASPMATVANAFAIRFSEMAKPVANAPHSPEIKASYCEIF